MKKWLIVLTAMVMGSTAMAGDGWMTDFEKAKDKAEKQDKHILLDFSGSDWCGWCIKLDNEVFSKEAFQEYADENLVLMLADFPRDKSKLSADVQAQNEKLMKQFGVRGFPTVFVLSPSGDVIARTGYRDGGPEKYVEHIKELIADAGKAKK